MKLQNIGLLAAISFMTVACSAPTVVPAARPAIRPIEVPVPKIKPRPKPKKPSPYAAKVGRYSENVATRVVELDDKKQTSIKRNAESAKIIDEESDRLDPYLSKSGSGDKQAQNNDKGEGISTAVMTLMLRAKIDMLAGRSDAAIEKLERGLRIQPNNPDLWNKLAEAHFHGEDYTQAISMAKKSIRLSPKNNTSLIRNNWRLVSKASKKMGDMDAMKAAMRAENSL